MLTTLPEIRVHALDEVVEVEVNIIDPTGKLGSKVIAQILWIQVLSRFQRE